MHVEEKLKSRLRVTLNSELNLKQKIVHGKNTSNIFLSSLLTFFTDNDVNYLDL